ncbi:hypothetical protein GCM10023328_47380 [Modestobacter marinus]|nr:hypothetical protein GCM10011589_45450 [Modestobacter marinus]
MDKAGRERLAVEVVYDAAELDKLEPGDKPDFVLAKRYGPEFGVEVTDLYETESNARLINVPGYIGQLFEGGPHIHRDDVAVLQVAEFSITDQDGNVKQENVRGVIQERSSESVHSEKLAQVIRSKNTKHAGYKTGLSHINLIIVDHFDRQDDDSREYDTSRLFGRGVREAMAESPFQEVFLVGYGPSMKFYYRPLRQLMLLEQFRVFGAALDAFEPGCKLPIELQPEHVTPLFVRVMERTTLALTYAMEQDKDWAVHHGCAVRLEDRGIVVSDYSDYPPRLEPCRLPDNPLPPDAFDALVRQHRDFSGKHGMTTRYFAPAAKSPVVPLGDESKDEHR